MSPSGREFFFEDRFFVQFARGVDEAAALGVLDLHGMGEVSKYDAYGIEGLYVSVPDDGDVFAALDRLESLRTAPDVEQASLAYGGFSPPPIVVLSDAGSGSGFGGFVSQSSSAGCSSPSAVAVAVYGDGIEPDHPNLNVKPGNDPGWDCTVNSSLPCEDGGEPEGTWDVHETTVAGVVSACGNSGGPTGIAPTQAEVHSIKAMQALSLCDSYDGRYESESYFLKAMDAVEGDQLKIVNISWNLVAIESSSAVATRLRNLRRDGFMLISSSGNFAYSGPPQDPPPVPPDDATFPASNPYVLSVGGLSTNGSSRMIRTGTSTTACGYTVNDFQARVDPSLTLSARAENVVTTDRTGSDGYSSSGVVTVSGTSWASPLVAGAAARLRLANPAISPGTMEILLCRTATDVGTSGPDEDTGCGRIDGPSVTTAESQAADWILASSFETSFEDMEVEWSTHQP